MLTEQIKILRQMGQHEEAEKVIKILYEHLMNDANSNRYSPDVFFDTPIRSPRPARPYTSEERLAMRMQWGRIEDSQWAPGFQHVAIQTVGDKVHVWVITTDAQSIVLEDDAPLFPSDALVSKLNMLKG